MSRRCQTTLSSGEMLGACLRQLRHSRGVPLRVVAAAADMDTALLSKVELGQRLPTEKQTAALAAYLKFPVQDMQAKRIAEKFWIDNEDNPALQKAATLIGCRQDNPKRSRNAAKHQGQSPATNDLGGRRLCRKGGG